MRTIDCPAYDKATERLACRYRLPDAIIDAVKRVAGIDTQDDTRLGDWELLPSQAKEIVALTEIAVDPEKFEFFIEPYVVEEVSIV